MKPRVIYYRFAYSPTTGDVSLAHNHEGHPALIRFHSDLAKDRPEKDIEAGYAFRLENGWKVTDQEFKPVVDPHRMVAVENAISEYEGKDALKTSKVLQSQRDTDSKVSD